MNFDSLQSRRTWIIGGAVAALLLIAASYFLVILPKLSAASDTRAQSRANDLSNTSLVARHGALARQEAGIAGMRTDLAAELDALPPTSALPEFTHEVTQAATASSVTLQNIGIGSLTAVTATAAAAPTPTATDSAASDSTSTASAAPVAAATAAPSQYQLSITLATQGPITRQLAFLTAIENGSRRALVTSVTYSGAGSKTVLTSQLNIFTAPMSTQQVAQLRKLLVAD